MKNIITNVQHNLHSAKYDEEEACDNSDKWKAFCQYWKSRCEAAEQYANSINHKGFTRHSIEYLNEWQTLKNAEPIRYEKIS